MLDKLAHANVLPRHALCFEASVVDKSCDMLVHIFHSNHEELKFLLLVNAFNSLLHMHQWTSSFLFPSSYPCKHCLLEQNTTFHPLMMFCIHPRHYHLFLHYRNTQKHDSLGTFCSLSILLYQHPSLQLPTSRQISLKGY